MNAEGNLSRAQAQQWLAPILTRTIRVTLVLIAVLLVVQLVLLVAMSTQCTRLVGLSGSGWVIPLDMLGCDNPGAQPVYTGHDREAIRAWAEKHADRLK
ncbi:hypothetical protein K2O51_31870 (plasmid) [Cupriavidus pinatubonensis]|uniref:hypothetical protein n=1 Tax=Cupriavidus pinatubonensis TaxID=248026 RepID=UPI001C738969|nr:hypothetical protein [Cupriavidus pinatubonensis]QYY33625.1 hypothetical protein K2O51_31870 [Cupriavidus pinatubonensis]